MWLQAFRLFLFSMVFSLHHNRRSGGAIKKIMGKPFKTGNMQERLLNFALKKVNPTTRYILSKKAKALCVACEKALCNAMPSKTTWSYFCPVVFLLISACVGNFFPFIFDSSTILTSEEEYWIFCRRLWLYVRAHYFFIFLTVLTSGVGSNWHTHNYKIVEQKS